MYSYWDLRANYINSPSWTRHWNPVSKVPYLVSESGGGTFISCAESTRRDRTKITACKIRLTLAVLLSHAQVR